MKIKKKQKKYQIEPLCVDRITFQEIKRFETIMAHIKHYIERFKLYAVIYMSFFVPGVCEAEVAFPPELNAQRVVVKGNKEYLNIKNKSGEPWLIQSWIEDLDGKKQRKMVFPEFARVEAFSSFNLTISPLEYGGGSAENMKWLTVRMMPLLNNEGNASFVIPVNYKLKVFFRTDVLSKKDRIPSELEWKINDGVLFVKNNSGFYYSFSELLFDNYKIIPPAKDVLPPYGTIQFNIPDTAGDLLSYVFINDFGDENKVIIKEQKI